MKESMILQAYSDSIGVSRIIISCTLFTEPLTEISSIWRLTLRSQSFEVILEVSSRFGWFRTYRENSFSVS